MKICIIVANYYKNISKNLFIGAQSELNRWGKINKKNKLKCEKVIVPGVFEIPYIISKNINKFISSAVTNGIISISIQSKKPIGNGILTCLNKKQATIRSDVDKKNKGGEAAKALIHLLEISRKK